MKIPLQPGHGHHLQGAPTCAKRISRHTSPAWAAPASFPRPLPRPTSWCDTGWGGNGGPGNHKKRLENAGKMLTNRGKIMEQPKSFRWKMWMENQSLGRKNGTFRLFLGNVRHFWEKLSGDIYPKMVDALIFWGGSNLFNHHVTSRFWEPGRCDPASFAETRTHNDSKWNWQTHNRPCRWKSVVFLPTKLHIRVSSELVEPHSISESQGVENFQFPIRRTAIHLGYFLVDFQHPSRFV